MTNYPLAEISPNRGPKMSPLKENKESEEAGTSVASSIKIYYWPQTTRDGKVT